MTSIRPALCMWTLMVTIGFGASGSLAADFRLLPPRMESGGVVLIPKIHYSSENEAGVSVQAIRPFRFLGQTASSVDSDIRFKGRIHGNGHGAAEAEVTVVLGEGRWFTKSKLSFRDLSERFWGIGSDTPSSNEEIFRPQSTLFYVEIQRRVFPNLRIGLRGEWQDYIYLDIEADGLLDTEGFPGLVLDNVFGVGIVADYDTRDNLYAPTRGIYAQGFGMFFIDELMGNFAFENWHLDLRSFHSFAGNNVLALQAFTFALFGDAPIWRFAAIGGRAHSRGYRRGRFLDRRMAAIQAEWRRPIMGRLEGVAFGGFASAAPQYSAFRVNNMRPTFGGGLRFRLQKRRNLILRGDLAFGEDSARGSISFGHAF